MIRNKLAVSVFLFIALAGGLNAATAGSPLALAEAESATLTLAGPLGEIRTFRFGPGETPALSLFDAEGAPLPDGSYTWELRMAEGAQSGSFTIVDGSLVSPDLAEQPRLITAADQVVPDDLIVDGKGCIGLGCVNNETFGTETLRLKQGVVRLRFQDTSTGLFPGSDWQITANDSASGGANRFSIEDLTAATTPLTIVGGAPSNSMYVASTGSVGIGTATPAQKLHVSGSSGTTQGLIEETHGTTAFRTMLELKNNGASRLNFTDTSVGNVWGINNNNGNINMIRSGTGIIALTLQPNGNATIAGTLTQNSDRDTKQEIVPVDPEEVLAKVMTLPISTWNRKEDDPGVRHMGPMAQDFSATFGLGTDERTIATLDMAGVSLASIQALHGRMTREMAGKDAEIQRLREQLAELQRQISSLIERKEEAVPAP